jgi:hypothetical protein
VQLLIMLGLILSIAGVNSTPGPDGKLQLDTEVKVAVILYVLGYGAIIVGIIVCSVNLGTAAPMEQLRIAAAVALALPFIGSRLIYSLLAVFVNNDTFALGDAGSIVVYVCMAMVEEYIVVAIYLLLGFSINKIEREQQGELLSRRWKSRGSRGSGGVAGFVRGQWPTQQPYEEEMGVERAPAQVHHSK